MGAALRRVNGADIRVAISGGDANAGLKARSTESHGGPGIGTIAMEPTYIDNIMLRRPETTEYAEFYRNYISRVPDGSLLEFLGRQVGDYRELFIGVSDEAAAARPRPDKWSAKEVLGHVCDVERVMSYRALRFARGDAQELHGFEQNDYVSEANSNGRSVTDLLTEFESIRRSTISLLGSLEPEATLRSGVANKKPVTVRALAYIIGGHAQHHLELLRVRPEKASAKA